VRKIRDFLKAVIGWASWKMADSLHKTFGAWHPHDAIDEDLGYWG